VSDQDSEPPFLPGAAYTARPKATPRERLDTHNRVRRDRVEDTGSLTLRAWPDACTTSASDEATPEPTL
jgi:hypothetical protein